MKEKIHLLLASIAFTILTFSEKIMSLPKRKKQLPIATNQLTEKNIAITQTC